MVVRIKNCSHGNILFYANNMIESAHVVKETIQFFVCSDSEIIAYTFEGQRSLVEIFFRILTGLLHSISTASMLQRHIKAQTDNQLLLFRDSSKLAKNHLSLTFSNFFTSLTFRISISIFK